MLYASRGSARAQASHRLLEVVVLTVVAWGLLLATAALAFAGPITWSSGCPTGTVHTQPQFVWVDAFDTSAFRTGTAHIQIDGVSYTTYLTNIGLVSGHWIYSETGPDANGAYTAHWTWTPCAADPKRGDLYCYPPSAPFGDGSHNVTATVTDVTGATSTYHWTFGLQIAPTIGAPTPAAGSRVTTTSPVISVPVADNSGVTHWNVTVNGAAATATFSGGVLHITSPVLPNDATSTVTVAVFDAAGNTAAKTWSFGVEIYPEMFSTIGDCASCHPTAATAPNMGSLCSACHPSQPHQGSPSSLHVKANVTSCSPCHVSDITVEHARWATTSGAAITCLTCHASTAPAVVAAILGGHAQCVDCHPDSGAAGHTAIHDTTVTPSCTGSGCHAGSNLIGIHINANTSLSCATCHASADHAVVAAISGHVKDCTACHSASSPHGDITPTHTAALTGADVTILGTDFGTHACSECHPSPVLTTIHASCATCHPTPKNTATPWNRTCVQGGCHTITSTAPMHAGLDSAHVGGAGQTCFVAGCHTGVGNVAAIHAKEGCVTCHGAGITPSVACAACHDTSAPHGDLSAIHTATPPDAIITISGISFGTHACSECHPSVVLTTIHASCATCHPTPKDTATPWNKTCTQGGCHTSTSTDPMHGSIDASHAIPADKAACLVSGCHGAGAITPFVGKSVAELHASVTTVTAGGTRTSCQICHTAGIIATTDCTSAGCHPDRANPHGYDAATHTGNPTATTYTIAGATYPALACSNCHSTELGVEHTKPTSAGNTGCAECHPALVAQLPPPWDRTTCAQGGCHTSGSAAPLHAGITTAHARLSANDACFLSGCHADGSLAAIHSAATTTVAGVVRTSCMVCHAGGVPAGANCSTCHDLNNPHGNLTALHTSSGGYDFVSVGMNNGDHDLSFGVNTNCSDCHITDMIVLHANDCATCHASSDPNVVAAISSRNTNCATCHPSHHTSENGNHEDIYNSGCDCHDLSSSWSDPSQSCTDCHGPHTPIPTPTTTSDARSTYIGDAIITLHPTDNVSGVVGIRATYHVLDGAAAVSGTQVTVAAPATGTQTHTLTFWSTDWSGNTEASHTVNFTVTADTTPPTTTSDAQSSYVGPAVIHLSATDDSQAGVAATYHSLDGGAVATSTVITLAQPVSGTVSHSLKFWSVDHSGNIEASHTATFTMTADLVAPHTTTTLSHYSTGSFWTILYPTDPAPSSGIANVYLLVDGVPTSGGPLDFGGGVWYAYVGVSYQGPHTITYWSTDNAGNAESIESTTVIFDWTPPTTTSNAVASYIGTATISLTASDNAGGSGVRATYWRDGSGGEQHTGTTVTIAPPASGTVAHTLYYWSVDNAGMTEYQNVKSFTVTAPDTTPPTGTMSVNNNATYTSTTAASVNSTVTDSGSGVSQMRIDPGSGTYGSWISYAASSAITLPSGDGTKTVNVQYRDGAGNVATLTDTIKLDTTAPSGTMAVNNGAATVATVSASVNSTVTDSGSGVYQMRIDPGSGTYGSWISYAASSAITLPSGDGTKTVNAQYKDNAGNVLILTDTIKLQTGH